MAKGKESQLSFPRFCPVFYNIKINTEYLISDICDHFELHICVKGIKYVRHILLIVNSG